MWNLLASQLLYASARGANCEFWITEYVRYECLVKPRGTHSDEQRELARRLLAELAEGRIPFAHVSIADLQAPDMLKLRRNLGKGELSALAFALKTRQALFTDDQGMRKEVHRVSVSPPAQTTPGLLGWLVFIGHLLDQDVPRVIDEHSSLGRPLRTQFAIMHMRGLEFRARASVSGRADSGDGQ
ncbi:MAG: hypothetical protein AB7I45_01335 [Planctomycetota bacterium]